jgi:CubicO group peptidase (beta-lactamase class C family)
MHRLNVRHLTFLVLLSLFTYLLKPLHANEPPNLKQVDTYLQTQLKANRIPGIAAAYVKNGEILFCKGYGQAAPGAPVTPETQFYLGSVTKSFTALAALRLAEESSLDLDTPVAHYLPWFAVADPEASGRITVRHLLNQTSGLSEGGDPNANAPTPSLEAQVRLMRDARLTRPVGTAFQYYNQNYRLLGLLIETVSQMSYADFLTSRVLAPLNMGQTVADPTQAENLSPGYSRLFGFPLQRPQPLNPGGLASGYLIS